MFEGLVFPNIIGRSICFANYLLNRYIFRKFCVFFSLDIMVTMGFARDEINDALVSQKYDEVMATYILLGRKPPEVSVLSF